MTSTRTPVVFIHGLWLHASSWQPWQELFAEAAWPGTKASRTAATAAAKKAGRPIRHMVRLTDMNAPFQTARRRTAPLDLLVEVGYARLQPGDADNLPGLRAGPHTGKPTTTRPARLAHGRDSQQGHVGRRHHAERCER